MKNLDNIYSSSLLASYCVGEWVDWQMVRHKRSYMLVSAAGVGTPES